MLICPFPIISLALFSLCDLNIFLAYITATFKEIAKQITLDKSSFPFHMTNLAPSNCVACGFVLSGCFFGFVSGLKFYCRYYYKDLKPVSPFFFLFPFSYAEAGLSEHPCAFFFANNAQLYTHRVAHIHSREVPKLLLANGQLH